MIFVSYSRADADFAFRLATDLRTNGVNVWLDQLSIAPGEPWDLAIERALQSSESVIVIMSPSAAGSHNVLDEIAYAMDERKNVIPVIFKHCAVPLRIRRLQRLNFPSAYEPALSNLISTLRPRDPATATTDSFDRDRYSANHHNEPVAAVRRRTKLAALAAAADRQASELYSLSSERTARGARGMLLFGLGGALSGVITLQMAQIREPDAAGVGFVIGCPSFSWAVIGALCEMRRGPSIAAIVSAAITLAVCCIEFGVQDALGFVVGAVVPLVTLTTVLGVRLVEGVRDYDAKRQRHAVRRKA